MEQSHQFLVQTKSKKETKKCTETENQNVENLLDFVVRNILGDQKEIV